MKPLAALIFWIALCGCATPEPASYRWQWHPGTAGHWSLDPVPR